MAKAPIKAKPVAKKVAVKKPAVKKVVKPATKTATKKAKATKSTGNPAKDLANERGEPYVAVLSVDIDPNDVQNGAFELDWNDKFIADLVRHGYMMDPKDTDADIVLVGVQHAGNESGDQLM